MLICYIQTHHIAQYFLIFFIEHVTQTSSYSAGLLHYHYFYIIIIKRIKAKYTPKLTILRVILFNFSRGNMPSKLLGSAPPQYHYVYKRNEQFSRHNYIKIFIQTRRIA